MDFNQTNLKTIVPAVVSAGILAYEALSGEQVLPAIKDEIANACLTGATIVVTAWGIWKNHHPSEPINKKVVPASPAPVPVQEIVSVPSEPTKQS